ncbi:MULTISPECIES: cytochrome P450 family protein [Streptomyces]|uniref:Cytochrome P450 hydroxylase n=1 Tax=Streptomyces xanthochromogenes TaxID=67384 RepID=A0ABQ3AJV9_9ACTN|nr:MULTISPECIES: cytochrome P450 [Streptomyces]MYV91353.1 cytochrome P450 [Streptomyces sp. SID1034]GGY59283.1 cytochrome P450 hydroxylase [Streptomyces xanthochromogenes]
MTISATAGTPEAISFGGEANPYALYARLRRQAPVSHMSLPDGGEFWLVTRYEDAKNALADPRLSKDPNRVGERWRATVAQPTDGEDASLVRHLLNVDPPDHTRLRRLVHKGFTPRRIEALRGRIQEITDGLLAELDATEGSVDLLDKFAFKLPVTVICELLGVPLADVDDIHDWSTALSTLVADEEGHARVGKAAGQLGAYLDELVAHKAEHPGDDLISALIEARDEGQRLSHGELTAMAFLMLIGGHETTVHLIGNGMLALMQHPDQLALLHNDPSLITSAIEEFLRYEGSVEVATWRFALEDLDFDDVRVPAGAPVLVSLGSAGRDPDRFENPDTFDITRGDAGHLVFGHGMHYCLGAPLARMEGQIAVGSLVRRFPAIRLAAPVDTLRWREGLLIRGLYELPVHLR